MATETFALRIDEADPGEPGLVLVVKDDLSLVLRTPDGKEVPVAAATAVRLALPAK